MKNLNLRLGDSIIEADNVTRRGGAGRMDKTMTTPNGQSLLAKGKGWRANSDELVGCESSGVRKGSQDGMKESFGQHWQIIKEASGYQNSTAKKSSRQIKFFKTKA